MMRMPGMFCAMRYVTVAALAAVGCGDQATPPTPDLSAPDLSAPDLSALACMPLSCDGGPCGETLSEGITRCCVYAYACDLQSCDGVDILTLIGPMGRTAKQY